MFKYFVLFSLAVSGSVHASNCNNTIYNTFASHGGTSYPFDYTEDKLTIHPGATSNRTDTLTQINWNESLGDFSTQKKEATFKLENGSPTSLNVKFHKIVKDEVRLNNETQSRLNKLNERSAKGFDFEFSKDALGKCQTDKITVKPQSGKDVVVFDRKLCKDIIPNINQLRRLNECSALQKSVLDKVSAYERENNVDIAHSVHIRSHEYRGSSIVQALWAVQGCFLNMNERDFEATSKSTTPSSFSQAISN